MGIIHNYNNVTYNYDKVVFTIEKIYDNNFTSILFDVKIRLNNLLQNIQNEILDNPNEYPAIHTLLNQLTTEDEKRNMIENYIYVYPGKEFLDDINAKVRLNRDENSVLTSLIVDSINYKPVDWATYSNCKEWAYQIFGDNEQIIDKFVDAIDDYISAYYYTTSTVVHDAVNDHFIDIAKDYYYVITKDEQNSQNTNEDVYFHP